MGKLRVLAQLAPWSGRIDVLLADTDTRAYVSDLVMKTDPDGVIERPTFSIGWTEAQELMDSLWNCGLRPTEGTGSAGSLKATENHLKDMRTIAFDLLERVKK